MVIVRSKRLFCKLGTNLLKFHTERNVFAVAVIWTKDRMYHSVKDYYWTRYFMECKYWDSKTIILPVVLLGCEYWSLKFSEELPMRLFECRVLRRIFGFKRDEVKRGGENYILRSLIISILRPIMFGCWNREEMVGACRVYGGRIGLYTYLVGKSTGKR